jgi:hypothetical protein
MFEKILYFFSDFERSFDATIQNNAREDDLLYVNHVLSRTITDQFCMETVAATTSATLDKP